MLRLNLDITNIKLDMKTDYGVVAASCSQPTSKGTYKPPQNKLTVTPVKVEIDSTETREAFGIYTSAALSQKLAQEGRQAVLSGIARRMRQGRQARDAKPNTKALVEINKENMMPKKVGVGLANVAPPKITVIPSKVEGQIDPGVCKMEIIPGKYNFHYEPASVKITVQQYASVKATVVGNYDLYA